MRTGLLLCLLLGRPTAVIADDCASWGIKPVKFSSVVYTANKADLPADGNVIVTAQVHSGARIGAPNAVNPSWRFIIGAKQITPNLVSLAPGLVLYRTPPGTLGKVTFVDGKEPLAEPGFREVSSLFPKPPAAPEPALVEIGTYKTARYSSPELRVTLASKPDFYADIVIVYGVTKQGAVPWSWRFFDGRPQTPYHVIGGRLDPCTNAIPGEIQAKVGDEIQLAFMDSYGRVGPKSKKMKVTKAE